MQEPPVGMQEFKVWRGDVVWLKRIGALLEITNSGRKARGAKEKFVWWVVWQSESPGMKRKAFSYCTMQRKSQCHERLHDDGGRWDVSVTQKPIFRDILLVVQYK